MNRFFAAYCAGSLALMAALDCGLPLWRDHPIGDATDFGVTAAWLAWAAIGALRTKVIVNNWPASVDTRRMAETGTGSVRSTSGAVGSEADETPNN